MSNGVFISDVQFYETSGRAPLQLSVTIGDGQVGGTNVDLDDVNVGSGEINGLPIGKSGDNLALKRLNCVTTVKDVNPATNRTSVTYTLSGGAKSQEFPYAAEVSKPGGYATYSITFILS